MSDKISLAVIVAAVCLFAGYVAGRKHGWDSGSSEAFRAAANGQMQLRAADPNCEKTKDGGYYGMRCYKVGASISCSECLGPK
jgi:hypothetical protein